jgi:hypothetical protein
MKSYNGWLKIANVTNVQIYNWKQYFSTILFIKSTEYLLQMNATLLLSNII